MVSKIRWGITWLAMSVLKRSLHYMIGGDNAKWLQSIPAKNISIFNRFDYILAHCAHKKILHIGFSDYPFTAEKIKSNSFLHLQIKNIASALLGLDNDKASIDTYIDITKDENVMHADITVAYPKEAIHFSPDIILISEVLEHLPSPLHAADLLYNSFAHGTKILVTVPNYASLASMASSFSKTESVHPHHYWYFSPFTLCRLFDENRFHLEELHFGMYYQKDTAINVVLQQFPFNGDCIMAVFSINKVV